MQVDQVVERTRKQSKVNLIKDESGANSKENYGEWSKEKSEIKLTTDAENMRHALQIVQSRLGNHHSEFYYKLQSLNDKVRIYKDITQIEKLPSSPLRKNKF